MSRIPGNRKFIAAVAVAALLTLALAGSAGAAPLAWTLDSSGSSASTINTATNKIVGAPIATGEGPNSIAITPDGRRAFVTNFLGNSVTVIETATRTPVRTIPLPSHAERIAISPDGKTAYATVESDENVYVIATESSANSTAGSFAVGPEAFVTAFSPDGKRAYVSIAPEDVQVIETGTGKLLGAPIPVGGLVGAMAVTPNGATVYASEGNEVAVINTALGQVTKHIPVGTAAAGLAVTPDGRRLYAVAEGAGTVTAIETATNKAVGAPLNVGGEPEEIAITPDGKTAYVGIFDLQRVTPIEVATNSIGTPIPLTGAGPGRLVVAPDQSPTAVFSPPSVFATFPSIFSGAASTDPDGTVAAWNWEFGDGGTATGVSPAHTYAVPGTYNASLSVLDNEGCGEAEVFTGRTAYCSGNPLAKVVHPVEAKSPVAPCSAKFGIGRAVHNRKNGTVRLQVRLPAAGSILLFGPKVHAVTRKAKAAGPMFLTIHARVELNKRLKKTHRANVRFRLTYTPSAGCGFKTAHRSIALLRAPRRKHHRHR